MIEKKLVENEKEFLKVKKQHNIQYCVKIRIIKNKNFKYNKNVS